MVLAFGGLLEVAGCTSLNYYIMMWVIVLEWSFGSMCGVGIVPSNRLFQNFTVWVRQGTLQWRRLCVGLVGGFIGIFSFIINWGRIGRKTLLIGLWSSFTLWKCGGLALTRFVGSQQGVEVLRLKVFISLFTLLPFHSFGGWCGNRRCLQEWLSFHGQLL